MEINDEILSKVDYTPIQKALETLFTQGNQVYDLIAHTASNVPGYHNTKPSLNNIITATDYTEEVDNTLYMDSLDFIELLMAVEEDWHKAFSCVDYRQNFTFPDEEASYMLKSTSPRPYSKVMQLPDDCLRVGDVMYYMYAINMGIMKHK